MITVVLLGLPMRGVCVHMCVLAGGLRGDDVLSDLHFVRSDGKSFKKRKRKNGKRLRM